MINEATLPFKKHVLKTLMSVVVIGALAALLAIVLSSCGEQKAVEQKATEEKTTNTTSTSTEQKETTSKSTEERVTIVSDASVMDDYDWSFSNRDLDPSYDATTATKINLNESSASIEGTGASVADSTITITEKGTYLVEGSLSDGSILVDLTDETAKVQIVLAGVSISCSDGPAILVEQADKVFITLAEGTKNTLSDGSTRSETADGNDHDGTIFSHDDITLNGLGQLTINGNYSNGIVGKDDVRITGGVYDIKTLGHAVQGKDCLKVLDGSFTITCGKDAFHASNDEDETLGYLGIGGGTFLIDAGDDAFHAHSALLIADGTIDVTASYEGFEGKTVSLTGGVTSIVASDDAVNAASSADQSDDQAFMRPGGPTESTNTAPSTESELFIEVTGGTHTLSAGGDCLDSNADLIISGGAIVAECRATGGDGVLDFDGASAITGGTFASVGPSDMAQGFGTTSTQASVLLNATNTNTAAKPLSLVDAQGKEICTFTPSISNRSFLFSSPDLVEGETYSIVSGGSTIGTAVAQLGTNQSGFGGGQPGGQPGGQQGMQPGMQPGTRSGGQQNVT